MEDFNALKQRVDRLESSCAALKKAYGDLEKEMNTCKSQDAKVAKILEELKAKETDSNVKKYLGM